MTLFFATRSYGYFRDELSCLTCGDIGRLQTKPFADGETYHRMADEVTGRVFTQEFAKLTARLQAHPILRRGNYRRSVAWLFAGLCPPALVWGMRLLLPPAVSHRLRALLT